MAWSTHGRQTFVFAAAALLFAGAAVLASASSSAQAPDDCFEDVPHTDVGIVFDESGSMSGEKIEAAKDGALQLTDKLGSDQHSGLVSFDSYAYLREEVGPDHQATSSAIENLTAGGSTATGDAIDLSHQDILASGLEEGRDVMVVLADGKTNRGSDPIVQADQAKADGIEIFAIAFGDGADEQELRQIASDPVDEHFYHSSSDDIEEVFLRILEDVTVRNDSQPPSTAAQLPQEGHLYIDGEDQGPGTSIEDDRATLVGAMPFQVGSEDNCYLERVDLAVPATGFAHEENATQITTDPFDADAVGPGDYTLEVEATDWVGLQDRDEVGLHVPPLEAETRVVGLWSGAPTPENPEVRSQGIHFLQEAANVVRTTEIDQPGAVRAQGIVEAGSVTMEDTHRNTTGEVRISSVELFDGLVEIDTLVHEATASVDLATGDTQLNTSHEIGEVRVAGEPVPVEDQGPVEIDLPGEGFVRLFEQDTAVTPIYLSYRSTLVHAHAPDAYGGAEVILGDVLLEPGGGGEPTPQARAIAQQDDADSGRDAGGEDGEPVAIDDGLYDGQFTPADTVDRYAFEAEHGEKIKVNLEPSTQAHVQTGSVEIVDGNVDADGPTIRAEPPATRIQLFDPAGVLRAYTTFYEGSIAAQSVELNADLNGTWTIAVERTDAFTERASIDDAYAHYSFDLTVTDHPLLPQSDALSGSDAPADCEAPDEQIPQIREGQWPGVLKGGDFHDVYRFEAEIGDVITGTVKPGETTDGVAMDLHLYDEDCEPTGLVLTNDLDREKRLKGVPRGVFQLPSEYTGTYYLHVERVNGVGNHHVTLSVRDPMPGLPTNDAHTGEDADHDQDNATPAPPGAFQGTLHDGDPGDAYALEMTADDQAWVSLEMSALSEVDVHLVDPDGQTVYPDISALDGTFVWEFEPDATGDHILVVEPEIGGGDYTVTWGQAPTSLLAPLPLQSAGLPGASTSP